MPAHRFPARWLAAAVSGLLLAAAAPAGPVRPGFDAGALPPADDGSSGPTTLGFGVNFFGQTFSSVYVNANGNVTFSAPLSDFTPVPLGQLRSAVIAPFFADVDATTAGKVSYGTGTVGGHAAFAATWAGVGPYGGAGGRANDFQVVLVDRADTGAGNFDAEFNYGRVQWESGGFNGGVDGKGGSTARVGFTSGTGRAGTFYELPGSAVPGALLDDGPAATALASHLLNSDTAGRYVLMSRGGQIEGEATPLPGGGDGPPPVPPGGSGGGGGSGGPGGAVGTPEPATLVLGLIGVVGLGALRSVRGRARR